MKQRARTRNRPETSMRTWTKNWYATRTDSERSFYGCSTRFSKTMMNFYNSKSSVVKIKKPETSKNMWRMNIVTLDMLRPSKKTLSKEKVKRQKIPEEKYLFEKVDNYIKKIY